MRRLYPKLMAADAIVIASPIYWFTVSAQTKLFMDRWYALGGADGYALAGKKFGVVLAYADADPFSSGAVNALRTFQDAFSYAGVPGIASAPCTAAPGSCRGDPRQRRRDEGVLEGAQRVHRAGGERVRVRVGEHDPELLAGQRVPRPPRRARTNGP